MEYVVKNIGQNKKSNSKPSSTKALKDKKKILIISIWIILLLFIFNMFTGVISYGAMAAWCMRPPITGSKFAASYTYFKPGETHYGPSAFSQYYCSEQDAKNAGLNPSPIK